MRVLVFGNPLVSEDSLVLRIVGRLRKKFPSIQFLEFDPTEGLEDVGRPLLIIDVVEGIERVTLITDIEAIEVGGGCSLHDFDLGFNLKLLKRLGLIDEVKIIGVPKGYSEEKALEEVSSLLSILCGGNESRNSCKDHRRE